MIKKEIIQIELHFDIHQECEDYKKIYEKKGYTITDYGTIISYGSEDDFYFKCKKTEFN